MTGQSCFARSLRLVIMITLFMVLLSACVPEHSKIMTYHGTSLSKSAGFLTHTMVSILRTNVVRRFWLLPMVL